MKNRKKNIFLFLCLTFIVNQGCVFMYKGFPIISKYRIQEAQELELIAALDTLWERYPEIRLDSADQMRISKYSIAPFYRMEREGEAHKYFTDPKTNYPHAEINQYHTVRHYILKSFDEEIYYNILIGNCLINKCGIFLTSAYFIKQKELVFASENNSDLEKQNYVKEKFEREIISKLDNIIKDLK